MLEIDEQTRKNREKTARYNQKPERKEIRRIASIIHGHHLTLITTMKRIQSHTLDDLAEIARMCCQNNPDRFLANRDEIMKTLAILHAGGNVQSNNDSNGICLPSATDSVSDLPK